MLHIQMSNASWLYILMLFAVGILMLLLAGYAFRKPVRNGTRTFAWLSVAIATYICFYAMELMSSGLSQALTYSRLQYVGIAMIPALAVLFVFQFTGKDRWLKGYRIALPFIIPIITIILKLTDSWHGLIYHQIGYEFTQGLFVLNITGGLWYWIFVGYLNTAMLLTAGILIRFFLHFGKIFQKQALVMMLGLVAPWIGHLIYQSGHSYMGLDSSPIYFSVFGVCMAIGIFKFGLFDMVPIAHERIFDSMLDGVVILDPGNRVVDLNPSANRMFPNRKKASTGAPADKFFMAYPEVISFIESGEEGREISLGSGMGQLIYMLTKNPVFNRNNKTVGCILSVRDITENKLTELALLDEKQKAEAANRAKSEFLANMSHEIRTPMNAILGFTETLYHRLKDPAHKKMVQSVASSGKLLLSLLNDILDLSKIEAGRLVINEHPTDLMLVFDEIQMLFSDKASQKGLLLRTEKPADFPASVIIDEMRIKQVLFNLVGNAVKFTHKGSVNVVVLFRPYDSSHGELILRVEDTGVGIAADQINTIFEPFHQQSGQSNREYGGTGLGLAITKRLLEKMNGSITVKSALEKGSNFIVIIPDIAYSHQPVSVEGKWQLDEDTGQEDSPAVFLPGELNKTQRQMLPELIDLLRRQLLPEWSLIQNQLVIFKIEAFADKIKEAGRNYGFRHIEAYAEKLHRQIDYLDLEGIKESLILFPGLIEQLESLPPGQE